MLGEGSGGRRRWVRGVPWPRRDPGVHECRGEAGGHATSKALAVRDTRKVLRETRHRVAKKARVAPAVGRTRKAVRIEPEQVFY